jgi:hypothetical protein
MARSKYRDVKRQPKSNPELLDARLTRRGAVHNYRHLDQWLRDAFAAHPSVVVLDATFSCRNQSSLISLCVYTCTLGRIRTTKKAYFACSGELRLMPGRRRRWPGTMSAPHRRSMAQLMARRADSMCLYPSPIYSRERHWENQDGRACMGRSWWRRWRWTCPR